MSYTIQGQAGKSMNATARSPEDLRMNSGQVHFESLAPDFFTYTSITDDATGAGVILPQTLQTVELFKDGVRKFKGHVTSVIPGVKSVSVRIEGPWYWMSKINLSGNFPPPFDAAYGGGGTQADQHNYGFPQQDLKTSITALLNRGIALSVPMAIGNIATMFTIQAITLPSMTIAAALAEMLRYCPDAVVWFDYTNTTPTINISRRGSMTPIGFAVGTDHFEGDLGIRPRTDLKLSRVELKYVDRDPTTYKPRWQIQASGSGTVGEIQFATVSGPNRVPFLPPDKGESFVIQTTSISNALVMARAASLAPVFAKNRFVQGACRVSSVQYWARFGSDTTKTVQYRYFTPPGNIAADGSVVGDLPILISQESVPSWVNLQVYDVTVAGTWVATWYGNSTYEFPADFNDLWNLGGVTRERLGYYSNISTDERGLWCVSIPYSFPAKMIATAYPSGRTFYKPPAYTYAAPPAGLAANFLACQNFVPWEGPFTLVEDDLTLVNNLKNTVNISGTLSDCATMAALPRSITYDIFRGRRSWMLGTPARSALGSLVNRVRQAPEDMITYI